MGFKAYIAYGADAKNVKRIINSQELYCSTGVGDGERLLSHSDPSWEGGGGGKRGRYSSLIIAKFPNIKLRFWGLVKFISVSAGIAHLLEIVIQQ